MNHQNSLHALLLPHLLFIHSDPTYASKDKHNKSHLTLRSQVTYAICKYASEKNVASELYSFNRSKGTVKNDAV